MTMIMSDLKPLAVAEFNSQITDDYARAYFVNAFDLWQDLPTWYTALDTSYKAIILKYVPQITKAVALADVMAQDTYTRLTTVQGESSSTEDTDSANTLERTEVAGENTQTQRTYPDGYISPPDTAYIAAEMHDTGNTNTDNTTSAGTTSRAAESTTGSTTTDIDVLARAAVLEAYTPCYGLIERLVAEFIGYTLQGVF